MQELRVEDLEEEHTNGVHEELLTISQMAELLGTKTHIFYAPLKAGEIPGGRMIKHKWYAPVEGVRKWGDIVRSVGYQTSSLPVAISEPVEESDTVTCHYCQRVMPVRGHGTLYKVMRFRINYGSVEQPEWKVEYLPVCRNDNCNPLVKSVRAEREQALIEARTSYAQLEELREKYIALTHQFGVVQDQLEGYRERLENAEAIGDAEGWRNAYVALEKELKEFKERLSHAQNQSQHASEKVAKLEGDLREQQVKYIELHADYEIVQARYDRMASEYDGMHESLRQSATELEVVSHERDMAQDALEKVTVARDRYKQRFDAVQALFLGGGNGEDH